MLLRRQYSQTVKLIITQFRITMAAIDPSAEPEFSGTATGDSAVRATLKLVRQPMDMEDDEASEGDSDEDDFLQTLLNGVGSEDEHSSSDEEKNGGPSDPTKTKKARKEAAIEQLKKALLEDDNDDMDVDGTGGTNGIVAQADKGKVKATGNEQDDSEEDDSEDLEIEEFVLCTLDPSKVRSTKPKQMYGALADLFYRTTSNRLTSQLVKMNVFFSKYQARTLSILLAIT